MIDNKKMVVALVSRDEVGFGGCRELALPTRCGGLMTERVSNQELLPKPKDAHNMSDDELAAYAQKLVDKSKFRMVVNPTGWADASSLEGELEIENPISNAYPIALL